MLLFLVYESGAQMDPSLIDPILIRLKGRLINSADSSGVPYATIINHRTHLGATTNSDGFFAMEILNIDSLEISSVGYQKKIIHIPSHYNGQEVLSFFVNPVSYAVGEVEVQGDKPSHPMELGTGKPVDIPVELRGDAFNEPPPILTALFNPISFWYYHLSQREQEKRKTREAMAIQKNWEMHSENYNKAMVKKLTGLNDAGADSFMIWFNAKNVLPYTANEYEVRASIRYYYELYKEQR